MGLQILFHELLTIQIPNTKIAKELHIRFVTPSHAKYCFACGFNFFFQDYNAKLSNIGLANYKLGHTKYCTHMSGPAMFTRGYAAPEYEITGKYQIPTIQFFNNT
jgi:hypothetical protein